MKKITPLGQQILDTILDVVVRDCHMGFIGWSIGETKDITSYVAQKLNKPQRSIDGGLTHLIANGYFSNKHEVDGEGWDVPGLLGPRHEAWLAYTRWNEQQALLDNSEESLESWEEWDGVDGTTIPFIYDLPNWEGD